MSVYHEVSVHGVYLLMSIVYCVYIHVCTMHFAVVTSSTAVANFCWQSGICAVLFVQSLVIEALHPSYLLHLFLVGFFQISFSNFS